MLRHGVGRRQRGSAERLDARQPCWRRSLLEALADEEPGVRATAAMGLFELGTNDGEDARREVMSALLRVLRDDRPMESLATAERVGALGDKQAEDALLEALSDEEGLVRRAALRSLRQLGWELHEPSVVRALDDPDPFVREEARFWQGDEG